jgi:hypothetical protein
VTASRVRSLAIYAAAFIALVAIQLLRQRGHHVWDTVWAEDGRIYAADAQAHPALATLFRGYAGYVQLVPRTLALGVRIVSPADIARYLAVTSAAVTALLALFVYRATGGWVRSSGLRLLLAATVAVAPAASFEATANITNLGWPFLLASFWAIAARGEERFDVVCRAVVVALTALTTTLTALLVPWSIAFTVYRKRRADKVVLVSLFAALGVQVIADRFAASTNTPASSSLGDLPAEFGVRVLASLVVGERYLSDLWLDFGPWLVVGAVGVLGLVVALAVPRVGIDRRWFALGAIALGFVFFLLPVWLRGTEGMRLSPDRFNPAGSRYVLVPAAMLLSAVVVLVDGTHRRWLIGVLVTQGALVIVLSYALTSPRSYGPFWRTELRVAKTTCLNDLNRRAVDVPITPGGLGWTTTIPCSRLR